MFFKKQSQIHSEINKIKFAQPNTQQKHQQQTNTKIPFKNESQISRKEKGYESELLFKCEHEWKEQQQEKQIYRLNVNSDSETVFKKY